MKCEIDGIDFGTTQKFLYHPVKIGMSQKEYYDKYIKPI